MQRGPEGEGGGRGRKSIWRNARNATFPNGKETNCTFKDLNRPEQNSQERSHRDTLGSNTGGTKRAPWTQQEGQDSRSAPHRYSSSSFITNHGARRQWDDRCKVQEQTDQQNHLSAKHFYQKLPFESEGETTVFPNNRSLGEVTTSTPTLQAMPAGTLQRDIGEP